MRVDGRPEWFWEVEISQPLLAAPATKTVRIYVRGCENHQNNKHEQLNTNVKQIGIETEPYISGTCWLAGWPNYDTLYLIFVGARDHVTPASHVVLGALWPFFYFCFQPYKYKYRKKMHSSCPFLNLKSKLIFLQRF